MKFKKGDFIRNKVPYDGESELMVIEIDENYKEYKCAIMKGKYNKEHEFGNCLLLHFDKALYYEKVG